MQLHLDSLIFDLDGTLWDATATVAEGFHRARQRVEYVTHDVTLDQVRAVTGQPYPVVYERLFPELSPAQREEFRHICAVEELRSARERGGVPYPVLRETLEYLRGKYRLFIVSNCQTGYIEAFLDHTQTGELFEGHQCFGTKNLPKADNIREIVEQFGLQQPAYVGDTEGDHSACRANGLPFLFAAYGFGTAPDYEARLDTFGDLRQLL
ncbi:HAD family hydrolase [Hymenobacter chitinivorans]|uniref:phosphoglycolate phosphatase n=1 Tax=Hymenobacter chitinivorans DSM 11115 TaxID=1121954 RepID=A0A2M9BSB5_9BACT|nr:HAD family hydrolase [Hymenobacter chitinivorans]PJJ60844.1 phosphoglycolate phosphatase [Hymenobacter chitinivorans DSM 11115]